MTDSTPKDSLDDREERLNQIVFEYESAIDRGDDPHPLDWVAEHPDFAPDLALYFEGLRELGLTRNENESARIDLQGDPNATQDFASEGFAARANASATRTLPLSRLGDYLLLERLGRGGEGTVYRARHRVNDHEVALKMVTASQKGPLGADLRIRDEAKAIAGLRHPHIVRIHFSGEDKGIWYYTMELMDGGSLDDRLDDFRKNPLEAARLLQKVAQGIHHAHSRGILHLDLKPANILLDSEGNPHVSDFGLALRIQAREQIAESPSVRDSAETDLKAAADGPNVLNMTRPQIRGTAPYMSPEMASGRLSAVSTAADVYGLGALLYTLLTGRPPIVGDSMGDTLFRVVHERPTAPRTLNKRVDRELQAICLKCLRKDPAKRYGSADALANDLGRRLRGEPTLAGEPTARKRAWFWFKRHPLGTALASLTFLVFWLAGVVGSLGELREGNRREAERLAHEARIQIKMIERAVLLLAKEQEFRQALQQWPDGSPQQLKHLDQLLLRANAECNSWFDITGGNPLVNLFVLNNEGVMLADTSPKSPSVGLTFSLRDYFQHFTQKPSESLPRDHVYVSRSFRSMKDSLYKVALSTRIWEGNKPLGVIVANVTIGHSLLLLDMTEEDPDLFIASPIDRTYSYRTATASHDRHDYIATLHRDYQDPNPSPILFSNADLPRLAEFETNHELSQAVEPDRGGAVVHYRRVGTTHLVVVSKHLYPWPIRPFLDRQRRPWAIAAVVVMVVGPLAFLVWSRRQRLVAATPLQRSSVPQTV